MGGAAGVHGCAVRGLCRSCGEDGRVYAYDLRKASKQLLLRLGDRDTDDSVSIYAMSGGSHACAAAPCMLPTRVTARITTVRASPPPRPTVNPVQGNYLVLGGTSPSAFLFDRRMPALEPVSRYTPRHMRGVYVAHHVTGTDYGWNGEEVIATYNDEVGGSDWEGDMCVCVCVCVCSMPWRAH
jgi:hypothetical protein